MPVVLELPFQQDDEQEIVNLSKAGTRGEREKWFPTCSLSQLAKA